jgi:hypothetical protein
MLIGSCLCGVIKYEIEAELCQATIRHCIKCRKASGASFATNALALVESFRFAEGADLYREWESSPGNRQCFCIRCGSPIMKLHIDRPENGRLRLGILDLNPGVNPSRHIFIRSRAAWVEIMDHLPTFEERGS